MYLEKKANTVKIGITEIATVKYMAPWFAAISVEELREATITGKVNLLGVLSNIKGTR